MIDRSNFCNFHLWSIEQKAIARISSGIFFWMKVDCFLCTLSKNDGEFRQQVVCKVPQPKIVEKCLSTLGSVKSQLLRFSSSWLQQYILFLICCKHNNDRCTHIFYLLIWTFLYRVQNSLVLSCSKNILTISFRWRQRENVTAISTLVQFRCKQDWFWGCSLYTRTYDKAPLFRL